MIVTENGLGAYDMVTYNPTVFHLVPDDAPTAFTENFKFPSPSIFAVLSLSLEILRLTLA